MSAISGIKLASIASGIKKEGVKDLMLATFSEETVFAGAFSTSSIVSPTIDWDRAILKSGKSPRALIVNSGNANSFTGSHGLEAIEATVSAIASKFSIDSKQILVSSTGVIGEKLPYDKIIAQLDELACTLSGEGLEGAAEAIMTTDTKPKFETVKTEILGKEVTINAIAKGAGMAAPNLATVLSYFFTDANISQKVLQDIFSENIEDSFNAFTIDGDMSTNDTALIFASNEAGNKAPISSDDESILRFKKDLKALMVSVCDTIVGDGEGVTKVAKIYVNGAESKGAAKNVAMSIANSPLVKTALNGSDPNWGRIVMAVGKAKEAIDLKKFCLSIGEYSIVKNGELVPDYDESTMTAPYMAEKFIDIHVDLGLGGSEVQSVVTTSDLSKGYIEINADYRT